MDFDPKHDQALDLPLRFPDDPVPVPEEQPQPPKQPSSTSMRRQKSQDPHSQSQKQGSSSQAQAQAQAQSGHKQASPAPPEPQPRYTVYIRVPAPRNGFVDPPDVYWNKEKDDALWRILSRASKNDIDWEQLAQTFDATVDFLLIQATILTERHVSQVRAQTRKVATLGAGVAGANSGGRDSPINSPSLASGQGASAGLGGSRFATATTPTSEAMGRTLSSGGGGRTASAETMRRTASAGSRANPRTQRAAGGASPGTVGGSSGSRRPSMEDSQIRPTRPTRPPLETISSFSPEKELERNAVVSPVGRGHPTFSPATVQQQQARLQSPLPIRPARPTDATGRRAAYEESEGDGENEGEDEDDDGFEPESPAATSDSGSSSSSTPSEPVMSRIFRRPPGHAPQQYQQQSRDTQANRQRASTAQGPEGDFGVIGLGISSGGSDEGDADNDADGDESENQGAFLRFKSAAKAGPSGTSGSGHGHGHGHSGRPHARHQHHHTRRSTADSSSSPSSSASASPTTKAFKAPTIAAAAAAAAASGSGGTPSTASAMAAARLQSSRAPGIKSPPRLQQTLSARSPAVRAAKAAASGISREGSEVGTTPSIGSSFSDLDDVSFTQSVLDEALGSKVEDTVVTPNPNHTSDPMSSSATRRSK